MADRGRGGSRLGKFRVTPELALLLKTLRAQSDLPAKRVAELLGKSPSYVSKLENGEVKTIRRDVLVRVLEIVAGGALYETALPTAMRALAAFMEPSRLIDQAWLLRLDVVEREVAIPPEMARDMIANMKRVHATPEDLVRLANRNLDTDLTSSFPPNEVVVVDYGGTSRLSVRVDLGEGQVARAFSDRGAHLPYLGVNCLVFAMFRLLRHPDLEGKMPPGQAAEVLRSTASYLDRWGIHSLTGFSHLISSDEFIARQEPLSRSGSRVVELIAEALDEAVGHDGLAVASQLDAFLRTLRWDPAFALKLMGMPFSELGEMGFRAKSRMLDEIGAVLERYDELPDIDKRFEEY